MAKRYNLYYILKADRDQSVPSLEHKQAIWGMLRSLLTTISPNSIIKRTKKEG